MELEFSTVLRTIAVILRSIDFNEETRPNYEQDLFDVSRIIAIATMTRGNTTEQAIYEELKQLMDETKHYEQSQEN